MDTPKITIIIPIYNSEIFLDKCITSIINQTYSNLEIILINDGSTDKSLEICQKFGEIDNRIIVFDKKNEGVSSARNKGLDLATGEFIGFVDSDDFISSLMFERMVKVMIQNNADVVECGYFTCDSDYKNIIKHELRESIINGEYRCSYMYLSQENTTNYNVNKLYNKFLFNDVRYPSYKFSEDYWVNTKIHFKCRRKVTIKECFYYYVKNDQSAVRKEFDFSKRIDTIKAAQNLYDFHYERFPDLCSFIALYICGYVLTFYFDMNMKSNVNNKLYERELRSVFEKYYPEIKSDALDKIRFKGIYIYLVAFKMNPKFYLILKKIYRKLIY